MSNKLQSLFFYLFLLINVSDQEILEEVKEEDTVKQITYISQSLIQVFVVFWSIDPVIMIKEGTEEWCHKDDIDSTEDDE